MNNSASLDIGIPANWLVIWRISLAVLVGFLAVILTWPKGGILPLAMIGCTAYLAYLAYTQFQFLFSTKPVLRADSQSLYYRFAHTTIFIAWTNIKSVQLITKADTAYPKVVSIVANASTSIANIFEGRFIGNIFSQPNDYIATKLAKQIKLLSLAIEDYDAIFSQLTQKEKKLLRFEQSLSKNHLDINLLKVKCDPAWLYSEVKNRLEKYGSKKSKLD